MATTYTFTCGACERRIKHTVDVAKGTGFTKVVMSGYADELAMCYVCSGKIEARNMVANGLGELYLVQKVRAFVHSSAIGWYVTNWPGTLVFPVTRIHRMPDNSLHFWFMGPEGYEWGGARKNEEMCDVMRTTNRLTMRVPMHEDYLVPYPYTEIE